MGIRSTLLTILNIISAFVGLIIGLRIVFLLIGANASTPVISWVYSVSESLISPFRGLLNDLVFGPNSVLDLTALVAVIVYAIIFSLISHAINSIGIAAHSDEVHSHV